MPSPGRERCRRAFLAGSHSRLPEIQDLLAAYDAMKAERDEAVHQLEEYWSPVEIERARTEALRLCVEFGIDPSFQEENHILRDQAGEIRQQLNEVKAQRDAALERTGKAEKRSESAEDFIYWEHHGEDPHGGCFDHCGCCYCGRSVDRHRGVTGSACEVPLIPEDLLAELERDRLRRGALALTPRGYVREILRRHISGGTWWDPK